MTEASDRLAAEGYCVLEGLLDDDRARVLDDGARRRMDSAGGYVKMEGALNELPALADLAAHPKVLEVVAAMAGGEFYLANNVCMMWCQPGAAAGRPHADWPLGQVPQPWPRFPMLVQTMWMLTDFTADNGATRVVPGSHLSGRPPDDDCVDRDIAVTGARGSVLIWHGALWHRVGPNTSVDGHRMGANIAYIPWFVHRPPELWPLVDRQLLATFPERLQQLLARSVAPA